MVRVVHGEHLDFFYSKICYSFISVTREIFLKWGHSIITAWLSFVVFIDAALYKNERSVSLFKKRDVKVTFFKKFGGLILQIIFAALG